jgi:peptidoglycan L-alanyl-D-glutamate endopeptidase CwlK
VRFTEGLRSRERQDQLLKAKKSWTKTSYHLFGRAVDVAIFVNGDLTWDMSAYERYNEHVQDAAEEFSQVVSWGGEWTQRDGVHFQLELLRLQELRT